MGTVRKLYIKCMDKKMRKILSSLIAILAITNMEAQQQVPRLVVYITVEQLRGDYIEYFYNTFGERGFKRLFNEGGLLWVREDVR